MALPLAAAPIIAATATAGAGGAVTAGTLATTAANAAGAAIGGKLVDTAAGVLLPRAAATVGLGAVAAAAVPWVLGAVTVWQLGKLAGKLFDD